MAKRREYIKSDEAIVAEGGVPPKLVVECFGSPAYSVSDIGRSRQTPDVFNGVVNILRYSVTMEVIPETKEVYADRLQEMWETNDNMHNYQPLRSMANVFGVVLRGDSGVRRKEKHR